MQHIRGVTKRDILFYVGFSVTNLKYMKRWYSFYYERVIKGQQPADLFEESGKSHQVGGQMVILEKGHQAGDFLQMPESFGLVPWKHHVLIISKCETIAEAFFYINKTIEEG